MSVTVKSKHLILLLQDLLETTQRVGDHAGVLVSTARGPYEDEVGEAGLLTGVSTDGNVCAHTYVPCTGSLTTTLWSTASAKAVLAYLKPLNATIKNHSVSIEVGSGHVRIYEDEDLLGSASSFEFDHNTWVQYPIASIHSMLAQGEPRPGDYRIIDKDTQHPIEEEPRTDFPSGYLLAYSRIAKRRSSWVRTYRWHQNTPIQVQIGLSYRSVVRPVDYHGASEDGQNPDADLYLPPVPEHR